MTRIQSPQEPFQVMQQGKSVSAPQIPLQAAINDASALFIWLNSCRMFKSPHTVRSYEKEAIRFRMWLEWSKSDQNPRLLADARAADVHAYLDYLGDPIPLPNLVLARYRKTQQPFAGTLQASSIRQAVVILATMYEQFRQIEDIGGQPYVRFNPFALIRGSVTNAAKLAVDAPAALEVPKMLPLEVWALVEAHLDYCVRVNPQDPIAHRNRWIVKFLYHSWFRRQEAASIKMGSFSSTNGKWKLHVVGKGNKPAGIVATSTMMDALRDYREFHGLPPYPLPGEDRPAVMPLRGKDHVSAQTIYRVFKGVLDDVASTVEFKNPETAKLLRAAGPHWMRHTGITHAADGGVDVKYTSKQARHSDIRTTIKNYYHPDDDAMREQLEDAQRNKKSE